MEGHAAFVIKTAFYDWIVAISPDHCLVYRVEVAAMQAVARSVEGRRQSMFLKDNKSGDLVEVMDVAALIDPCAETVNGRFHAGEEMPEAQGFAKAGLSFPSGEALPQCWVNPDYKH